MKSIKKTKKGVTSPTDFYYALLLVVMIFLGGYAMLKIGSEFRLQEPNEGIGYRTVALVNVYQTVNEYMFFVETTVKSKTCEAYNSYLNAGLQELYLLEDDVAGCGLIADYPSWRTNSKTCFPNINSYALQQHFNSVFINALKHPLFKPVIYTYNFVNNKIYGYSQEDIILPMLATYDFSEKINDVLKQENLARGTRDYFSPEVRIPDLNINVVPDNNRLPREINPEYIVFHYSGLGSKDETINALLQSPESVHYVIDIDGSITQMVPEDEIANHIICDQCSDMKDNDGDGLIDQEDPDCKLFGDEQGTKKKGYQCLDSEINTKSIGIMLVNKGWKIYDNSEPLTINDFNGACPNGYVNASRNCAYTNYRPEDKIICEQDPKQICWQKYTPEQYDALNKLTTDIARRRNISLIKIKGVEYYNPSIRGLGPAYPLKQLLFYVTRELTLHAATPGAVSQDVKLRSLIWPLKNYELNSCYGNRLLNGQPDFHDGIDINGKEGDEVVAIGDGTIVDVCNNWVDDCACSLMDSGCSASCKNKCLDPKGAPTAFGNYIIIKHDDDLYSRYSHLKNVKMSPGMFVKAGETIGELGNTGYSGGAHLDLKIYDDKSKLYVNDAAKNPLCYFDQSTLLRVSATSVADSCRDHYGSPAVMNFNNPTLVKECQNTNFKGLSRNGGCYPDFIQDSIQFSNTITQGNIVETKNNLNKIKTTTYGSIFEAITVAGKQFNVDPTLILGIITQESKGDPEARSPTGPVGIMQFNKATWVASKPAGAKAADCCTIAESNMNSCNQPSVYDCFPSNDDRFNPEIAVFGGAKHLRTLLDAYSSYKNREYLAVQAYNSGEPALNKAIKACNGEDLDCIIKYFKQNNKGVDAGYAKKVLAHKLAWGGSITTTSSTCADINVNNIGFVKFKPNFVISGFSITNQLTKLIDWSKKISKINNDLNNTLLTESKLFSKDPDWNVTLGFCKDEDIMNLYLKEVVLTLQECLKSSDDECVCEFPKPQLEKDDYKLTFLKNGRISLTKGNDINPPEVSEHYLPFNLYFEDGMPPTDNDGVVFEFKEDGSNLKISFFALINGVKKSFVANNNLFGFYKNDTIDGFYDKDVDYCLPSKTLFPICAESSLNCDVKNSVVKFAMELEDTKAPIVSSVSASKVTGSLFGGVLNSLVGSNKLLLYLNSNDNDVVGYKVWCEQRTPINIFNVDTTKPPVRTKTKAITLDNCDLKNFDFTINPITKTSNYVYDFIVKAVDSGGNTGHEFKYTYEPKVSSTP